MADVSKLSVNGTSYNIKDATSRTQITALQSLTAGDWGAIPTPSSPTSGDFLVYNGSAWVAQSLSTWQGGSY